jgi:hypothetical protein
MTKQEAAIRCAQAVWRNANAWQFIADSLRGGDKIVDDNLMECAAKVLGPEYKKMYDDFVTEGYKNGFGVW